MAQTAGPHFRTIGLRQGLSNSQVGCFLKDSRGYVWFGTLSGLDRFDGFRFKNFYSTSDTLSLLSDYITRLEEDVNGDDGWLLSLSSRNRVVRQEHGGLDEGKRNGGYSQQGACRFEETVVDSGKRSWCLYLERGK